MFINGKKYTNPSSAEQARETAFVYGSSAGIGGLGIQSANAIAALAACGTKVAAFGPGHIDRWPLSELYEHVRWHESPLHISEGRFESLRRRWHVGRQQLERDISLGLWASEKIKDAQPESCYVFTQVGLEVLRWAKHNRVPSVLESPNGHIRNFREVYERESRRWCGAKFRGHPSPEMVARVEEEYELADRIRVSSEWARQTMVDRGVPREKIQVLQQPVDLNHFRPPDNGRENNGPLRVCFVGSLDLRKGFIYLLRALKLVGPARVSLEIVGATGTRCCARLFAKERRGLNISSAPGDPLPPYHRAEVFVLPSLEDGSPFAVAEAMACGLPVVVTDSCGSAEWVREGESGWVVPAREPEALAQVLEDALKRRPDLSDMGKLARADTEQRAGASCFPAFRKWFSADLN